MALTLIETEQPQRPIHHRIELWIRNPLPTKARASQISLAPPVEAEQGQDAGNLSPQIFEPAARLGVGRNLPWAAMVVARVVVAVSISWFPEAQTKSPQDPEPASASFSPRAAEEALEMDSRAAGAKITPKDPALAWEASAPSRAPLVEGWEPLRLAKEEQAA
jgi:hypothetical protein